MDTPRGLCSFGYSYSTQVTLRVSGFRLLTKLAGELILFFSIPQSKIWSILPPKTNMMDAKTHITNSRNPSCLSFLAHPMLSLTH